MLFFNVSFPPSAAIVPQTPQLAFSSKWPGQHARVLRGFRHTLLTKRSQTTRPWLRDASSRPRAAACASARAQPPTTRAKDPTRECFLSIPTVVGVQGAESVLEIRPHLNYAEAQKYDATADTLEHMCAQLPPVGPMTRTDALDAGAARKEAYEEAA